MDCMRGGLYLLNLVILIVPLDTSVVKIKSQSVLIIKIKLDQKKEIMQDNRAFTDAVDIIGMTTSKQYKRNTSIESRMGTHQGIHLYDTKDFEMLGNKNEFDAFYPSTGHMHNVPLINYQEDMLKRPSLERPAKTNIKKGFFAAIDNVLGVGSSSTT